jgi:molybdopterin molybdotransferase
MAVETRADRSPPLFGVVGWHNSGKTTLLVRLIAALGARGYVVSTVKHAPHVFDVDQPGKDSYRHRDAGAREVLVASSQRWALMHELRGAPEPSLNDLVARLGPADLVLVEGFKAVSLPKLEVYRSGISEGQPLAASDARIVAIATDLDRTSEVFSAFDKPVFGLADIEDITTQLSKDGSGGALLEISAALETLRRKCQPMVGQTTIKLGKSLGRILSEDVVSTRDVPPADNSAVDGYAVNHADLSGDCEVELPVTGRAAAGNPLGRQVNSGEAIRIFTGAPMPGGTDTVLMQEDGRLIMSDGGGEYGRIAVPPGLERGDNARTRGEDVAAGSRILKAGRRLRPQDIGLAASIGLAQIPVYNPLRVAVFSTGDEVSEPGANLATGGIYDANRYAMIAMLNGLTCEITDLGILPDDQNTIAKSMADAVGDHDLILTSGGVSVGEEDHVRGAVEQIGKLEFWRLAIKPGRPIAMGEISTGRKQNKQVPFIGLPGNPAAMMVTFLRIARPAILALSGATDLDPVLFRVSAGFEHKKKPGRREFVRARLNRTKDGELVADKFGRAGAGILTSFVETDGLVELPEEQTQLRVGDTVEFLPFSEVM